MDRITVALVAPLVVLGLLVAAGPAGASPREGDRVWSDWAGDYGTVIVDEAGGLLLELTGDDGEPVYGPLPSGGDR